MKDLFVIRPMYILDVTTMPDADFTLAKLAETMKETMLRNYDTYPQGIWVNSYQATIVADSAGTKTWQFYRGVPVIVKRTAAELAEGEGDV